MAGKSSVWRILVSFTSANLTGAGFGSLIASVNQAHQSTQRLTAAMSALKIAGGEALMAVGHGSIDMFSKAAEAAGKFQLSMTLLKQSMGDPSQYSGGFTKYNQDLYRLSYQRQQLMLGSNPVLFGTEELTKVQLALLSTGFSVDEIAKGKRGKTVGQAVSYLAEIEQLRGLGPGSAEGSARNVAQFMKAYGLTGEGAYGAMDTLGRVEAVTPHFSSSSIKTYEQYFGSLSRTIGMKAPDFITLAGFFSRMGALDSTGATSMNNLFLQTLDSTKGKDNPRFEAAMRLGMVGHVNIAEARTRIAQDATMRAELGLPGGPMTAAQIEKAAKAATLRSMPNMLIGAYRANGLEGIDKFFQTSRSSYISRYGENRGKEQYAVDLATMLNLRGARAGYIISSSGTLVDPQSALHQYIKQVGKEQPIDTLIRQARSTLGGQEATASSRMNAIMLSLGGVNLATGLPTAGGPLATVIQLLKYLNQFMSAILLFTSKNPDAAGKIGTAIGVFGIVATAVGAMLTGMGALGLLRIGLGGLGGGAVVGAAVGGMGSGIGRVLSLMNPFRGAGGVINAIDQKLASDFAFLRFGSHAVNPAYAQALGPRAPLMTRAGNLLEVIGEGLGKFLAPLGRAGDILGIAAKGVGMFGLRLLGIIGWVTLAVDVLSWFSKHPQDVAHWVALMIKAFRDVLVPGVTTAWKALMGYLVDEIKKMWDLVTHPQDIGKWWSTFTAQVSKEVSQKDPKPAPNSRGGANTNHHTTLNQTNHIHGAHDPKKTAELITKHAVVALGRSLYSTVGGTGIPGHPHAATGTG